MALLFSEYYFYLVAYNMALNADGALRTEHEYPAYYRVDRIRFYRQLEEHFAIPYPQRFETGEFRKRVQFMYGGKLRKIRFKYTGASVEAILDRLPTAKIVEKKGDGYIITAEVFGDGVDMWIRSQGENVKLL